MKDIAIIGAGGFGKEIASLICMINSAHEEPVWNIIGFFDDNTNKHGTQVSCYGSVLGTVDDLNEWSSELSVAVAIGSAAAIQSVVGRINNPRISFPNIIHPSFDHADNTYSLGQGNIIQRSCFFSCDVKLGNFNVLNGSVVFGHDCMVGDFNVFMPAVRVSGSVTIGNGNFFGVGSIVLQQLKIGSGVRLGAGSVLMYKPKDDNLYLGNPAKLFKF